MIALLDNRKLILLFTCFETLLISLLLTILAIGYADGVPRALSGGAGYVLLHGRTAPVVGRICMDQMTVDITGIENVRQNDVATLIGVSGDTEITAAEVAAQAGTITNDLLSRLGNRLERIYRDTH
ncbi:hypothetical protein J9303_12340 [Bacillaceae bacterium Marseille-Q3522]|nr:hypothetical protein [Bacillaceae bacterium Marseille-Q3522]